MDGRRILVVGEVRKGLIHSASLELTGKARELADKIGAEVYTLLPAGEISQNPADLFKYGADKVVVVLNEEMGLFNQEIFSRVVAAIVSEYEPEIVMAPATTSGRSYMPVVAAVLGTGLTADCTGLDIEEETGLLLQTRPAIGGNIMATIKTPERRPQMATVRPRTFRIPEPADRTGEIIKPVLSADLFRTKIENLGITRKEEEGIDIQDMDVVVSGGKGLKRPESFDLLRELSDLLGGGIGASRPTVDAKWMDYPHQVGLSGKVVSPKLYIAAGISGAVQHLAGMQTSGTIIAVNKDPEAPIFRVADIALCGDLFDILPRLIERIREERSSHAAN